LWSAKISELQGPLGNPRYANTQYIRNIAFNGRKQRRKREARTETFTILSLSEISVLPSMREKL
jgi:hypothetical protein